MSILCSFFFSLHLVCFFFFNDTATTEIYTLSLHDALPISILPFKTAESWYTRMHVAYGLKRFDHPTAQAALIELRQDKHHKVVAAALEGLLP